MPEPTLTGIFARPVPFDTSRGTKIDGTEVTFLVPNESPSTAHPVLGIVYLTENKGLVIENTFAPIFA